jgi:hypothetical protein
LAEKAGRSSGEWEVIIHLSTTTGRSPDGSGIFDAGAYRALAPGVSDDRARQLRLRTTAKSGDRFAHRPEFRIRFTIACSTSPQQIGLIWRAGAS